MKYTILINQYAAVTSGMDLDLIDLCIFDFIKDFSNTNNCIKMQTPEGVFFWISHKLVMKELPLLNIKTPQGMAKRITNLINQGVLMKHPNCEQYSKTLYAFGENYDMLCFTEKMKDVISVSTPKQKFHPPETKVSPPPKPKLYHNTIKDNSIIEKRLFADIEVKQTQPKKTLFRNSIFGDEDNGLDILVSKLVVKPKDAEVYSNIDIGYYYSAVSDWSDSANKTRTERGWIATVRTFIRGDNAKGKLKMNTKADQSDATEYLNS